MTPRTVRRLLWLTWLVTVPLPMLALDDGLMPSARYLLLGGVTVAVQIVEGADAVGASLAAIFLIHAFVYSGLVWTAAWASARVLSRLSSYARARATLAIVSLCVALALFTTPYRTPFGPTAQVGLIQALR